MKCNIKYIENNSGLDYWCLSHKTKATSISGEVPTSCDCKYKERYENLKEINPEEIKSIKIIYPNLIENPNVEVYINDKQFNGILKIKNSIIDLKDYGGMMLSKLNNITLESSKCPYCGGMHTDNGKFAYTPHSKHLCIYCGHFYNIENENIGNEIALYFDIPDIVLEDNVVVINQKCEVTYDLLSGKLYVNDISCQRVKLDNKEIDLVSFLNDALKNEY